MKKKLVVLTGAGISAESGINTFRDAGGLWEGYDVMDVATPEAWDKNPALVQRFYNERRAQVIAAQPNAAHLALVALEAYFDVHIVTQNVDDLHERAGSTQVLHLHGNIRYAQSSANPSLVFPIEGETLSMGDCCPMGSQLRPHVVWFGEAVPMIEPAAALCKEADIFAVIGTSLAVYPAASLVDYVKDDVVKYIIDPAKPPIHGLTNIVRIAEKAVAGVQQMVGDLLK